MKILGKIIGAIVVVALVALIVLRITGFPPKDRRPGLWITGPVVTTPVNDWSFTDQYYTIQVQTNTWYGIPHSVNTFCIAYQGDLYLLSIMPPGAPKYPGARVWDQNVARDPRVRLKIGGKVYDRVLVHITDPTVHDALIQAQAKKYPKYKYPQGSDFNVFHVTNA